MGSVDSSGRLSQLSRLARRLPAGDSVSGPTGRGHNLPAVQRFGLNLYDNSPDGDDDSHHDYGPQNYSLNRHHLISTKHRVACAVRPARRLVVPVRLTPPPYLLDCSDDEPNRPNRQKPRCNPRVRVLIRSGGDCCEVACLVEHGASLSYVSNGGMERTSAALTQATTACT